MDGGGSSSHLIFLTIAKPFDNKRMTDKNIVKAIVDEWLSDKEYFLVDTHVDAQNKITVEIDHKDGVWIDDCVELSRFIESKLDRDVEDYELEVGSAGIGQPFKVVQQYLNHVGKDVEVITAGGKKLKGTLNAADKEGFVLCCKEKVKVEGKKRPELQDVEYPFSYQDVKSVKAVIDFK